MIDPALRRHLSPQGADWLASAVADVQRSPTALAAAFPAVSRRCGRAPLADGDDHGLHHGCVDDAARAVLLQALTSGGGELVGVVEALYRYGEAGEKRGVLRAAHLLDDPVRPGGLGAALLPAVHDGLRTNDVRIVAASLGEYGARHLPDDSYRQAVVKCVFVGVPLSAVRRLGERQDAELARMLVDLAHERTAAGRPVPSDVRAVVAAFPESLARPDLPRGVVDALTQA